MTKRSSQIGTPAVTVLGYYAPPPVIV